MISAIVEVLPNAPTAHIAESVAVSRFTRAQASSPVRVTRIQSPSSLADEQTSPGVEESRVVPSGGASGLHLSTLRGVSKGTVRHEAGRVKPARATVARSRTTSTFCSDNNSSSDASRIKPVASEQDFQFARGAVPEKHAGAALNRSDVRAVPSARRTGGARPSDMGARSLCRVVRLTGGFLGPTGFDVAGGSELTVPAALDRREKRATSNCERQRGFRSGCGLIGAGEQGARVAHQRHHTSWAARGRRLAAEILTVVEAPTPRRQGLPVALNPATHVSEVLCRIVADRGSIPRGSTTELQYRNGRRVPCSENTAQLLTRKGASRAMGGNPRASTLKCAVNGVVGMAVPANVCCFEDATSPGGENPALDRPTGE